MARFLVPVPMNFGRETLGSPVYDNLVLKLEDERELRANNFILSCNSPVIAHLTFDLMQTTIDVDDFSEDAVKCFIDAAYSGTLELLTEDNFRDLNKMVRVFDVQWMKEGCRNFFKEIVGSMTFESIAVSSYVINEAIFVKKTGKDDWFINLVIDRIDKAFTLTEKGSLLKHEYSSKMGKLENDELDFIHSISSKNSVIVSELMLAHLPNLRVGLDDNTRYILQKMNENKDSSVFGESVDSMFEKLLEVEGLAMEDMKFIVSLQQTRCLSLKDYYADKITNLNKEHTDLTKYRNNALKSKNFQAICEIDRMQNSIENTINHNRNECRWCHGCLSKLDNLAGTLRYDPI